MTEISISDGRVCIIKVVRFDSIKEGLEELKNALLDFSAGDRLEENGLDTYVFVDLTPFNIINSSLIGILGSIITDRKIRLLALCNLQPAVEDILKRFGVIGEADAGRKPTADPGREMLAKVLVFDSIEEALACLIP